MFPTSIRSGSRDDDRDHPIPRHYRHGSPPTSMTDPGELNRESAKARFPLSISRKIWLSLSILLLGYSASMVVGFLRSEVTSTRLAQVSESLFPAAVQSQVALTAFKEEIELFSDVVTLGEVEAVEEAQDRSRLAEIALNELIERLPGHIPQREAASDLLTRLTSFTEQASPIYLELASSAGDEELEAAAGELAESYSRILADLVGLKVSLADHLKQDLREVSATTRRQQYYNLALFLAVVGSALLLVSLIVSRSITRPLQKAMRFARTIASGDLSQKLDIAQNDEIGALARAINIMAGEIEKSQSNLELQVRERTAELKATHQELMITARQAGMADVASAVLHNVGNVLNSVNVTTSSLRSRVEESKVVNLARAAELLESHAEDLCGFLTEDPKGRKVPTYLIGLSEHLSAEREKQVEMLERLSGHIQHITTIISRQQSLSRSGKVRDEVEPRELLESAIQICFADSPEAASIEREYQDGLPTIVLDRHKTLQIVVNLLKNAKQAVEQRTGDPGPIHVSLGHTEEFVTIAVTDNGVGIREKNMARLFTHGFSTKRDGHGFGLHSACLAAKEMGGSLTAASDGANCGARFTLQLPLQAVEVGHA